MNRFTKKQMQIYGKIAQLSQTRFRKEGMFQEENVDFYDLKIENAHIWIENEDTNAPQ
ncbi:MAG: hypothetical protein IJ124_11120 [Clostridia bacterium]|nr:hypothetical protein [Clostridia bacterium]